jgi:hypothetical protein
MSKPRLSAYSRIAMLELDPHRIGRNPLQNLVQVEQSFSHVALPRLGALNRAVRAGMATNPPDGEVAAR